MIQDHRIDNGNAFDWGRTSDDYAKYRDIYPPALYQRLLELGLCTKGQRILDIGTGTGVLPRNMYTHGASFVGADISQHQIEQAQQLSATQGMDIEFICRATEQLDFPAHSFDGITACQCFFYFQHDIVAKKLHSFLLPDGKFAIVYMEWLPREDAVAAATEQLVLQYNPHWSGSDETRHFEEIPTPYLEYFTLAHKEIFDARIPFTRKSWSGRIRACRGIGASLSAEDIQAFEAQHMQLLRRITPDDAFTILHYCSIQILQARR